MAKPIFYDPSGHRSRLAKRSLAMGLVLVIAAAMAFASTLLAVPRIGNLAMPFPQPHASAMRGSKPPRGLARWLPRTVSATDHTPLTVGFYDTDDEASLASLQRHVRALDWVVPAFITIAGPQHALVARDDARFGRLIAATRNAPKVLPLVQNYQDDHWDSEGIASLLANPALRQAYAARLGQIVASRHYGGLVIDFEALPNASRQNFLTFLRQVRQAIPAGSALAVTAPAADPDWPLAAVGRIADRVILMAYDEHWEGGQPGPIASQTWFINAVTRAQGLLGRDKLTVALASYAYDWHQSGIDSLSVEEAWLAAHDSDAPVAFDGVSGNQGFAYDENGEHHSVWMVDAASSWNQLQVLKRLGLDDVALWRLGSEDPGFWSDLLAFRQGGRPNLSELASPLNVDVEGLGEILRITSTPTAGQRTVSFDPQGMIRGESYLSLPTPYVVQRAGGGNPKLLALTFDDGPDATWTPRILDVLEANHVPATFFVIGENALRHPQLLNRIVSDGSELGNHTYTHPNLATVSTQATNLELNTTQRLIEAYTGRSTRLFRAPYFGDAEPTTADELNPALEAQRAGYSIVGLHVDTEDWQRPGVDQIVAQTIDGVHAQTKDRSTNIILLHDGGGERAQTVAALPIIIARLRAEGYQFVPVSALVGQPQAAAMPRVSGTDLWAVRTDVGAFIALAAITATIAWVFYVAIALGIARAIIMAALATIQSWRRRAEPPTLQPSVSVIIPAFNEERVIRASVERVLASDYPNLQVIVADDGSKDRTSAIVAEAFGTDARVGLLTLTNGGKAAALNRALREATGEIVIALDADTQFEVGTIRRLARWFDNARIGAVAGDARVGNRVNLVTRWQAVEYITSQNLERRALAGFDAMTVVPGAVGAWRRTALDQVGGYPENTLAEDQDLTIAIQRAGWRVTYDPLAVAWTEAPETFRALARQRYRWAFGTLQCLWKHCAVIRRGRPTGLALIGLPQAWLFQIIFAAISPVIDFALLASIVGTATRVMAHGWAQTRGDVGMMGLYWLAFTSIDVICGWIAYRLDGNRVRYPAPLLIAQRFVYRQIMYWVVLRAIASAIGGWVVGWGKLERTGRVSEAPAAP